MEIIKCDERAYRAREEINASRLALAFKSIRHFTENIGPKESDAMKLGTALHYACLEPGKFKELYVVEPEEINAPIRVTKGSKTVESGDWGLQPLNKKIPKHRELIAQWHAEQENKGALILTQDQMSSLSGMLNSLNQEMARETDKLTIGKLINETTEFEVAAIGQYQEFPIKGRADIITTINGRRIGIDLKKTVSAHQEDFVRKVFNLHYDLQCAFYSHLFNLDEYYWLAVEEKPAGNSGLHPIGLYSAAQFLPIGQKKMEQLFDKIRKGGEHWYTDGVEELVPTSWMASMYGEEII